MKRLTMLALVLISIVLGPGFAPAVASAAAGAPSLTAEDLGQFLDGFFAAEMAEHHVPGAAVAVVKGDRILLTRGYGVADAATRTPVDPSATVFRVGSLSKLLTATAVMQEVERGAIDLQADVNQYLTGFRLPDAFDKPVTVESLLTHTSGFTQLQIGIGTRTADAVQELDQHLAQGMPPRMYPPGAFFTYSNQGMSLAGHLVEQTSGLAFADYVEQRLFTPLGMTRTTFRQPLPEALESGAAAGHTYMGGAYATVEPLFYHVAPAGALATTAEDMARFMTLHLNGGRYHSSQVLGAGTIADMHRQRFTYHDKLPGTAIGFREYYRNGRRGLWHTGTTHGFGSVLLLLPEEQVGLFVALNRAVSMPGLRGELMDAFIDRYFPATEAAPQAPAAKAPDRSLAGTYWEVEKPQQTMAKLEVLIAGGAAPGSANGAEHPGRHGPVGSVHRTVRAGGAAAFSGG